MRNLSLIKSSSSSNIKRRSSKRSGEDFSSSTSFSSSTINPFVPWPTFRFAEVATFLRTPSSTGIIRVTAADLYPEKKNRKDSSMRFANSLICGTWIYLCRYMAAKYGGLYIAATLSLSTSSFSCSGEISIARARVSANATV